MPSETAATRRLNALEWADRIREASIDWIVVPRASWGRHEPALAMATDLAVRWERPLQVITVIAGDAVDLVDPAAPLRAAHPDVTIVADTIHAGADEDEADALAAKLRPSDLVVMATDAGRSDGTSFAQRLAHTWGGPVMMLGPACPKEGLGSGIVAVALDGSALAERAIPLAHAFAIALDVPLMLVQVVSEAVSRQVATLAERGERVSESAYVSDLAARLVAAHVPASWSIVHDDDPVRGLQGFLEHHDTALLVMTTHGRSGLPRPAFGSTCLDTVSEATVPVLVQRPTAPATAIIAAAAEPPTPPPGDPAR